MPYVWKQFLMYRYMNCNYLKKTESFQSIEVTIKDNFTQYSKAGEASCLITIV